MLQQAPPQMRRRGKMPVTRRGRSMGLTLRESRNALPVFPRTTIYDSKSYRHHRTPLKPMPQLPQCNRCELPPYWRDAIKFLQSAQNINMTPSNGATRPRRSANNPLVIQRFKRLRRRAGALRLVQAASKTWMTMIGLISTILACERSSKMVRDIVLVSR